MYYYLLDQSGLSDTQFEARQSIIMSAAHEFNISGESGRATLLRTIPDLVGAAYKHGAHTLVVCGSDDTFNKVLGCLDDRVLTVGFVPMMDNSQLAGLLGIDSLRNAIKIIAARRVKAVDLAQVNSLYFFSFLEFGWPSLVAKGTSKTLWQQIKYHSLQFKFRVDNKYEVDMAGLGGFIINARWYGAKSSTTGSPTDGFLDVVVAPHLSLADRFRYRKVLNSGNLEQLNGLAKIPARTIEFFEPRDMPLTMLGRTIVRLPVTVQMAKKKLSLIIGRDRTF